MIAEGLSRSPAPSPPILIRCRQRGAILAFPCSHSPLAALLRHRGLRPPLIASGLSQPAEAPILAPNLGRLAAALSRELPEAARVSSVSPAGRWKSTALMEPARPIASSGAASSMRSRTYRPGPIGAPSPRPPTRVGLCCPPSAMNPHRRPTPAAPVAETSDHEAAPPHHLDRAGQARSLHRCDRRRQPPRSARSHGAAVLLARQGQAHRADPL